MLNYIRFIHIYISTIVILLIRQLLLNYILGRLNELNVK